MESDLPDDIRDEALLALKAAVDSRMSVGDAIAKVQKDALFKVEQRFAGQRFKGPNLYDVRKQHFWNFGPQSPPHSSGRSAFLGTPSPSHYGRHMSILSKGFIKFDNDNMVVQINVNKFGNGNAQFSADVGVKKMVGDGSGQSFERCAQ